MASLFYDGHEIQLPSDAEGGVPELLRQFEEAARGGTSPFVAFADVQGQTHHILVSPSIPIRVLNEVLDAESSDTLL